MEVYFSIIDILLCLGSPQNHDIKSKQFRSLVSLVSDVQVSPIFQDDLSTILHVKIYSSILYFTVQMVQRGFLCDRSECYRNDDLASVKNVYVGPNQASVVWVDSEMTFGVFIAPSQASVIYVGQLDNQCSCSIWLSRATEREREIKC